MTESTPIAERRWRRIKPLAKRVAAVSFPVLPGIHHLLLAERKLRKGPLQHLMSKVYYEPLLRVQCERVGRGLVLYEDMPKLMGKPRIILGSGVVLAGAQVWIAAGDRTEKRIEIGDNSYVGHATELIAGSSITIGRHVQLANRVVLNGYDGHPLDPLERASGEGPPPTGKTPIRILDYAWLGNDVTVLRGITIGRGAVVASCSVVTRDVPELAVVAGNPAKVIRQLPVPAGW